MCAWIVCPIMNDYAFEMRKATHKSYHNQSKYILNENNIQKPNIVCSLIPSDKREFWKEQNITIRHTTDEENGG